MKSPCPVGQRYGRLVVVGEAEPSANSKRMWSVVCDCGVAKSVQANNLVSGNSASCGRCTRNRGRRRRPDGEVNRDQAFKALLRGAQRRNLKVSIMFADWLQLSQQDCRYCGTEPSNNYCLRYSDNGEPRSGLAFVYNGLDRVDSGQGYTHDNVVPCCIHCNRAKNARSLEEFLQWVRRVHTRMISGGNGEAVSTR